MTSVEVYRGKLGLWAYDWSMQAEQDEDSVIATLNAYGIDLLVQEVRYGKNWQPGPAGQPRSLAGWTAFAAKCRDNGILFSPLVLPRGLPGEAQDHGAILNVFGHGWVDFEYDPNDLDSSGRPRYWGAAPGMAKIYASEMRGVAPDAAIIWEPDARIADNGREAEYIPFVRDVAPYVSGFGPQLYSAWTKYGGNHNAVIKDEQRFDRFAAFGLPMIPTLWTADDESGGIDLATLFANWAIDRGAYANVGFRLGATGVANLEEMGRWKRAMTPEAPAKPQQDNAITLDEARALEQSMSNRVIGLSEDLRQLQEIIKRWES